MLLFNTKCTKISSIQKSPTNKQLLISSSFLLPLLPPHHVRCCPRALMSSQCCRSTCPTLTRSPTLSTHWRCWRCSKWTEKERGRNTNHSQSSTTDSCSGTAPGRPTLWEYYPRYVVVLLCMHAQYLVSVYIILFNHCDGFYVSVLTLIVFMV